MTANPRIAFIGAGSTVFMKNIIGDILQRKATSGATIALMDVNPVRLKESEIVAGKIISTLGVAAKLETHGDQRRALAKADFVGGIMRGLRTVPHLWKICEDMMELCPGAHLLQYVNPMAINT